MKTMTIKGSIKSLTNDGHTIAQFLVNTMEGETDGVKVHHRLDAAKQLIRYGFSEDDSDFWGLIPTPEELAAKSKDKESVRPEPVKGRQVTFLDILNYEIAHLIRHETAEGHTIANFLVHIMTGKDRPFTPKKFRIKPADRMAAARELLRRGFGDFGSRRKLSDNNNEANAYDALHTDLAKRMREYSERGADAIRFLLEVMIDPDPDEEFTVHHRMSAAQELLRRGWDTNYDNIKPERLQDYWRDEQSTRLSIGQKKTQAGLSTSIDDYDKYDDTDYEAIAKEIREEEDREAAASKSLHPRYGKIRACPELAEGMGMTEPVSKSLPLSKSVDEPADRKAIIKEFREAMSKGDERAALRAQAKYRRIDIKAEKNIYDYGPNDPDPTIDYYFEPLNPEEQAKFDEEERREYGLTEEEIAEYSGIPTPSGKSDPLPQLAQAAALHGAPILPNPLAGKRKKPTIRSP